MGGFFYLHCTVDIGEVTVSSSVLVNHAQPFELVCSVDIDLSQAVGDVPSPTFEWFFGRRNASIPSGARVTDPTKKGKTYTSILQFSPLHQSHAGLYTCRLGGNVRLAANSRIIVNAEGGGSTSQDTVAASTHDAHYDTVFVLNLSTLCAVLISASVTILLQCSILLCMRP